METQVSLKQIAAGELKEQLSSFHDKFFIDYPSRSDISSHLSKIKFLILNWIPALS